jgi:adenylate kinase family enzyme
LHFCAAFVFFSNPHSVYYSVVMRGLLVEKIVIIGSSGAGKSTLARALGSRLNVKVFHLDRHLWQCNWKGRTEHARRKILKKLTVNGEKQWIIEGNYLRFSKFHVDAADTIIFLDIPPLVCCWHLLKRHYEYHECSRHDIPEGCMDRLTVRRMVTVLTFQFHGQRIIEQTLYDYEYKCIIRLSSVKEIEEFLNRQEQILGDRGNSSDSEFTGMERILAAM